MNKQGLKIANKEVFAMLNIALFIILCFTTYYDRFVIYRGQNNIWEFFLYAIVILIVVLVAWIMARPYEISNTVLILGEIIILIHFAGGLVILNDIRLYDNYFFGIRFDKYVHFIQTLLAGLILYDLHFKYTQIKSWIKYLQILMIILGIGSLSEIIEYLVTLTVVNNGVGDYNNNMQDMISNFLGATMSIIVLRLTNKNSNE